MNSDQKRSKMDMVIFAISTIAVIGFDRLTKNIFSGLLDVNESLIVIKNILHFTLVHNTGIAFGLFKDSGSVFVVIPLILTGLLVYNIFYYRNSAHLTRTYIVAFSLILGGAIGNLIDRVRLGYVVDFLDFHYKTSYYFPAFNVADFAICVGVSILLLSTLSKRDEVNAPITP